MLLVLIVVAVACSHAVSSRRHLCSFACASCLLIVSHCLLLMLPSACSFLHSPPSDPTPSHHPQQVEKKTFAEEVNNAFKEAANGPMKGVLAVCEEPLVSVDFRLVLVNGAVGGDSRHRDVGCMWSQLSMAADS